MAWHGRLKEVHMSSERSDGVFSDLAARFEGKQVRVYLANGAIISGRLTFKDGWIQVTEEQRGKSALCNLNHVISISLS